jgi:transposase
MLMIAPTPSVSADRFELCSRTLGALPIVRHFLGRMRLGGLLERYLPGAEARDALPPARAIGVLVGNLCVSHRPLYALGEWARAFDPALLGLSGRPQLSDDQLARALDRLFVADRASLLTELALGVIGEFQIDCSQLHNDSTSITVHGQYRDADGAEQHGKPTPAITYGHNKDHRPDLKQLLWILTVSADGALPLAYRLADGNTTDEQTHVATWDGLRALVGHPDFLYVADCKLCTREQMQHIDSRGGRFVTVLPRSRKEDGMLRAWLNSATPEWSEAWRRPGKRKQDPEEIWWTAPAPIQSAEGHRLVLVRSTLKRGLDQAARADTLARGIAALQQLQARLQGPKCRFKDKTTVQHAADDALRRTSTHQLIRYQISEHLHQWTRIQSRGRGQKPGPRKYQKLRFELSFQIDQDAINQQAAADGYFPLISNDNHLSETKLLAAYRYQPNLEKRHHQLKSIHHAAPVFLKTPHRIEALFCCHYIALLCCCLIERELRNAMTQQRITHLPLFPEQRACRQPTATRTLELFTELTHHRLYNHERHIADFPPQLTPLQTQLLQMLGVPQTHYTG